MKHERKKFDLKNIISENYQDWFMYTAGMGVLPSIIKVLLLALSQKPILFETFRVEIFFLTIIFLVDALKKYDSQKGKKFFTSFSLIISVVIYTAVLLGDMEILNVTLSNVVVAWAIGGFLVVSVILDLLSIDNEVKANVG